VSCRQRTPPKAEEGSWSLQWHIVKARAAVLCSSFVIIIVQPIGTDSEKLKTLPYRGTLDDQSPHQEINTGKQSGMLVLMGLIENTSFNHYNCLYMPNE
jgi:hypothetical protein